MELHLNLSPQNKYTNANECGFIWTPGLFIFRNIHRYIRNTCIYTCIYTYMLFTHSGSKRVHIDTPTIIMS